MFKRKATQTIERSEEQPDIVLYAVEIENVETGEVEARRYLESQRQATAYAHNKSKGSRGAVVGRVYEVSLKIVDQRMLSFTLGAGVNTLEK